MVARSLCRLGKKGSLCSLTSRKELPIQTSLRPPMHATNPARVVSGEHPQTNCVNCCTAGWRKPASLVRSLQAAPSAAAVRPQRASLHGPARCMPTGRQ